MQTPHRSQSDSLTPETVRPENKVWYLKHSRLFDCASDETIAYCEHLFVQQVCTKGHVLFHAGDAANFVYLVKRGMVRITRRTSDGKDILIAILGPGSIFGEEVVFSQVERNTIAVCTAETLLCMARAEHVYGLLTRFPQLAVNVAKYLHEQRDNALAIVEDLAYLTVPQRLLRQLNRLKLEYGNPVSDGVLLDIRLTHADLAALIGTTRETISVQLAQLVAEGLVRIEGRSIVLLNRVAGARATPRAARDGTPTPAPKPGGDYRFHHS